MERKLTIEEQQIETEAIAKFVADAREATPEERKISLKFFRRFATEESEFGARPKIKGHLMSVAGVREAIRQVEELDN